MKNQTLYFLQISIIISLEIVSFICFGSNHHLIPTSIFSGTENIIFQLIANIIYLLIYFLLYIFVIGLTTQKYFNKNKAFKSVTFLFLLRIAFDILNLWLSNIFVERAFVLNYILENIFIIFIYFFLVGYYACFSFRKFLGNKKSLMFSIIILLVTFILNIAYYYSCLKEYDKLINYTTKYNASNTEIKELCNNVEFICNIRGLCLLIVVSILMMILTAFATFQFTKSKKKKSGYNIFVRAFATTCVMFIAICIFAFLKNIISPTYSLCDINFSYKGVDSLSSASGFDCYNQKLTLTQIDEFGNEINIYNQEKHYIFYNNKKLLKIKPFSQIEINNLILGDTLILNNGIYEIVADNITAKRFSTYAIMYENKNNEPIAVLTEEIPYIEKDAILTIILEKLISEGYWDYFEYGCDYLLKYDPKFIKPYIERYAKGEFTETELETNYEIKTEYMVNFAQKYINTVN